MTKRSPDRRPNCEEILSKNNLWSLNENDFEFINEWKRILNSLNSGRKLTIHQILAKKIRFYLEAKFNEFLLVLRSDKIKFLNFLDKAIDRLKVYSVNDQNHIKIEELNNFDMAISIGKRASQQTEINSDFAKAFKVEFFDVISNYSYLENKFSKLFDRNGNSNSSSDLDTILIILEGFKKGIEGDIELENYELESDIKFDIKSEYSLMVNIALIYPILLYLIYNLEIYLNNQIKRMINRI
jgi:hypothetical protein